ncbi:PAS domain-containing sensor histidine kinase [Geomesophilobacter sediminis]|uniref:histidine kinase n=1 Tax=Geomesophilobacter sediminis TaxID=2798584 RepID=A0A8J7LTX2_9BACT|nr:PAS domain-containing protein [Geomesophilobacter sediminis]MBJ6723899.1 PAS domain-containing protein [Geomesophilobacter sediminis]
MFLHPEERQRIARSWRQALEAGTEWSREFRCLTDSGALAWVHGSAVPIRDARGEITGYLGCNRDITRKTAAETALQKSEERYRLALDATHDGLWDLEVGTDNCYFSQGCFEMLGYAGDEQHAGTDWLSIVNCSDLARGRETYRDCVEGKIDSFEVEFRIKSKKGTWKWILVRGKATSRNRDGMATRMVGTFIDISERKQIEELLRMEHNLLELITLTSPVGIMFINRQAEIIFTNPRAEQILGFSRDGQPNSGQGTAYGERKDSGPFLAVKERVIGRVLESGEQILNHCVTIPRPEGEPVHLSLNAAPFREENGQIGGIVATFEDVTELKSNEQALSDNAWLLAEGQRIANLGSYVQDLKDNTRTYSSTMQEIFGLPQGYSGATEDFLLTVHPDFREAYAVRFSAAVAARQRFEMEYKIIRPRDGEERWVAEFSEVQMDNAGPMGRLIGTVQDVTQHKASEEAIRTLNDELDRRVAERTSQLDAAKQEMESFSYSVSHDLRAPLRHINSYSSLLIDEFSSHLPKEAKHYLERICAASSRMGLLIDDLLMLTRVSRAEMKHNSFSISRLAEEVAEMLRTNEPERTVDFVIAGGLSAKGDSVLVRLVLENLMQNAMKYSSKVPTARIEFGRAQIKGKNAFFVRDNGVGFDMSYSDKLFQPFQRLHGAEFEGTGIGLATVKKIVQRHGGCVWAEGVENEGATFFFTLPDKPKTKYEGRPGLAAAAEY